MFCLTEKRNWQFSGKVISLPFDIEGLQLITNTDWLHWPEVLILNTSSSSIASNNTSTWMINFAAIRLPSIYAPFETCNSMSLIHAADDSSKADNKVHIRVTFVSRRDSASRACAGDNITSGVLGLDLFARDANLTFQYYYQFYLVWGQTLWII